MKRQYICGLDIGSSKVCATCATVEPGGEINILETRTVAAQGLHSGRITDARKLSTAIKEAAKRLYAACGVRVRRVYANIDSPATISRFVRCIRSAGLIVEDLTPSGRAQGLAIFRLSQPLKHSILIDFGAGLTKITRFKDSTLENIAVLPLGAHCITEDIALKLKVGTDCAEQLKIKYGRVGPAEKFHNQKIIARDGAADKLVVLDELYAIISLKANYLLQETKKILAGLDCGDGKSAEIAVTGGGALLEGFLEKAEEILERQLKIGFLYAVQDNHIQAQSALYATSIGLVRYGSANINKNKKERFSSRFKFSPFADMVNQVQGLYSEYF